MAAQGARSAAAGAALALLLAACELPYGLGLATTRELEAGATETLASSPSLELAGGYQDAGVHWSLAVSLVRPDSRHLQLDDGSLKLEAVVLGQVAYFRGREYLAQHLARDARSQDLARLAGDSWWKGELPGPLPALPDFTDGPAFRSTFLGAALSGRTDHASVDGVAAVDLWGPRADVYLAEAAPHQVLRVRLRPGAVVDGIHDADFRYRGYGRQPPIAAPAGVIDFSDLSTLPPLYTVLAVDSSRCKAVCTVSASVKNLGGRQPAAGPSTVTFKLTDPSSGTLLGSCVATVAPDVGLGVVTTASCTIPGVGSGPPFTVAALTATPSNPGRGQ